MAMFPKWRIKRNIFKIQIVVKKRSHVNCEGGNV